MIQKKETKQKFENVENFDSLNLHYPALSVLLSEVNKNHDPIGPVHDLFGMYLLAQSLGFIQREGRFMDKFYLTSKGKEFMSAIAKLQNKAKKSS